MAATRKLQGEIDRCLKKVAEGVETFEDIWKKVHNATNSNQKEKYEADLKKEIKKLQRLRDQIKSWIASAEIKDKSALLENRRLIETQMERFKIVERETKTKAYSKEGLGAAQKMDPAQRIKDEARNWLTNSISSLQIQIDQYESEIESLLAGKKKRLDRDKQERMDELRSKLERHKFHVTKLETLLRLLDNDGVEAEQVNKIKDDVEYYIDSSQEPDFEENEFIYDDIIGLDEVELSGTGFSLGISSSATTDSNNSNETSGSPSSITSGVSPPISPQPMLQHQHNVIISQTQMLPLQQQFQGISQQQQSQQVSLQLSSTTLNTSGNAVYTQDLLNVDALTASGDKRIKTDTTLLLTNKQPVKPTAIRAVAINKTPAPTTNEAPLNKISNTTPSKNNFQSQQQQQSQVAVLGNIGINQPSTNISALSSSLPNSIQQQQQSSNMTNINMPVVSSIPVNSSSTLHGQSVIQGTSTIAFAAVAKNNSTSHLENGNNVGDGSGNSYVGTSSNTSLTVSNITKQQQQQQQAHQPNLPTSATNLQNGISASINQNHNSVDAISLKTMAQEAINRTSIINSNSITPQQQSQAIDTRQQQQQSQQQQQQNSHFTTNIDKSSMNQIQQNNSTAIATAVAAAVAAASVEATQNGSKTSVQAPQANNLNVANNLHQQQQQQQQQQTNVHNNSTTGNSAVTTAVNHTQHQLQNLTNEAHIPPLLGVAPLGPSLLNKDHQLQFQMMEAAFYHLPQPIDSEKMTTYFHRTPVQTPSYYPQSPLQIYDTVEFYQRLSTETLFFVFYYMEGSKAQYLAAKALKKQSWRFHTKYMMWFQRHEEPKIINDDYEQGTYIYFDYEKWSQRKKEGFTFEYKYLEDKELN